MERLFHIWEHERSLLVQRLTVYLLINSILFLAFVELLTRKLLLGYAVASVEIIVCIVALAHFRRVGHRLGKIEKELKGKDEELGLQRGKLEKLSLIGGKRRARWEVALVLASLFLVLWIIGLVCMFGNG